MITYHTTSPLAGGFLTGKLTAGETAGTRFEAGNQMTGGPLLVRQTGNA